MLNFNCVEQFFLSCRVYGCVCTVSALHGILVNTGSLSSYRSIYGLRILVYTCSLLVQTPKFAWTSGHSLQPHKQLVDSFPSLSICILIWLYTKEIYKVVQNILVTIIINPYLEGRCHCVWQNATFLKPTGFYICVRHTRHLGHSDVVYISVWRVDQFLATN